MITVTPQWIGIRGGKTVPLSLTSIRCRIPLVIPTCHARAVSSGILQKMYREDFWVELFFFGEATSRLGFGFSV